MATKIFALGRPGSGKSTAARHIEEKAKEQGLSVSHITDLPILYDMLHADTEHRQFAPNPANDFDVIDFAAYDTALLRLGEQIKKEKSDLTIIEFGRDDYKRAFELLGEDQMRDAFFLFCEATTETCLSRVHGRNTDAASPHAHPTRSDERYREYYGKDNFNYMSTQFEKDFPHAKQRLLCIFNEGITNTEFLGRVNSFAETPLASLTGKETQSAMPLGIPKYPNRGEEILTIQQTGLPPERR